MGAMDEADLGDMEETEASNLGRREVVKDPGTFHTCQSVDTDAITALGR